MLRARFEAAACGPVALSDDDMLVFRRMRMKERGWEEVVSLDALARVTHERKGTTIRRDGARRGGEPWGEFAPTPVFWRQANQDQIEPAQLA